MLTARSGSTSLLHGDSLSSTRNDVHLSTTSIFVTVCVCLCLSVGRLLALRYA